MLGQFGPLLDQTMGTEALERFDAPGDGKDFPPLFQSQPGGNQGAAVLGGFHNDHP